MKEFAKKLRTKLFRVYREKYQKVLYILGFRIRYRTLGMLMQQHADEMQALQSLMMKLADQQKEIISAMRYEQQKTHKLLLNATKKQEKLEQIPETQSKIAEQLSFIETMCRSKADEATSRIDGISSEIKHAVAAFSESAGAHKQEVVKEVKCLIDDTQSLILGNITGLPQLINDTQTAAINKIAKVWHKVHEVQNLLNSTSAATMGEIAASTLKQQKSEILLQSLISQKNDAAEPLISVIVPVYNSAQYLPECLTSICLQTLRDIEIIVVDDASTDDSLTIIKEYAALDSRIRIIELNENKGKGGACNCALEVARGKWVTGVDANDYLNISAYASVVPHLSSDIDVLSFGGEPVGDISVERKKRLLSYMNPPYEGKTRITLDLIKSTDVYFWNKLWRKSMLTRNAIRFTEGHWHEDACFLYSAYASCRKITYLKQKLYIFRQNSPSVMKQPNSQSQRVLDYLYQIEKLLEFLRDKKLPSILDGLDICIFKTMYSTMMKHATGPIRQQAVERARKISVNFGLSVDFLV